MLFILIDYGERTHEVVFGPMTEIERSSHFGVALALGRAMRLGGLPTSYAEYRDQRHRQLLEDYARGPLTDELYVSYHRAFGSCGWCKPACYRTSYETFSGSSRTPSSTRCCSATATCPAAATSCAPYTAYCCRVGSPSNCAGWNAHQMPDGNFDFMASAASLAKWIVVLSASTFLPSRRVETAAPLGWRKGKGKEKGHWAY